MGITELLTAAFIVLKLLGKIDWSWWLVLLPEIIAAAIYIMIVIASAFRCRRTFKQVDKAFRDIDRDLW